MPNKDQLAICIVVFFLRITLSFIWASQLALVVKNLPANVGQIRVAGSILALERSPRVGNGNQLQYSCLENPMDKGAWWAIVHGVTKSQI